MLLAYVCACPLLYVIDTTLFLDELIDFGSDSIQLPSINATIQAVAVGFVLPIIYAIIQAQQALDHNIGEVLNTKRQYLFGKAFHFDSKETKSMTFFILSVLVVALLVHEFIILPKSLSTHTPSLLVLQLGLAATVVGLTLLIVNFRRTLENILVSLLFFWQKKAIRILLKKNLKAHYAINRLAFIIYALSFSCIILTTMSFNIASKQFNTYSQFSKTADIIVVKEDPIQFDYKQTDKILQTYSYKIKSFAYLPESLAKHQYHRMSSQKEGEFYIENAMKVNRLKANPIGVQPSKYFDDVFKQVRQGQKTSSSSTGDVYVSGLNATEQLYTARGVQSMAVSEEEADEFALDPSNLYDYFMFVDDGDPDYSPLQLYTRTSYVV